MNRNLIFVVLLLVFSLLFSAENIEDELARENTADAPVKQGDNDDAAEDESSDVSSKPAEKKQAEVVEEPVESSPAEDAEKDEKTEKEPVKILVQNIESVDVDPSVGTVILETVVNDLGGRKGYEVTTAEELAKVADVSEESMKMGCEESEACMVAVQEKLNASLLISGRVGMLDDEFVLTLNTVDVNNNTVGERISVQGTNTEALSGEITAALDQLLGKSDKKAMFTLAAGETLRLAVMPLSAQGIKKSTADALTQILSAELNAIDGISVIGRDDIEAMLSKVEMDAKLECLDNLQCIVDIGASFGLSKLITGSVGRVKNNWVISGKLIDVREAKVLNRVLESFNGREDELKNAIRLTAYRLAGVDYREKAGGVNFSFNVREAKIQFGRDKDSIKSGNFLRDKVVPGRYFLRVVGDTDDYLPMQTDVYVAPGAVNVKTLTLQEAPTPWYKTWWFWTITGTVVAGAGATTAIILSMDNSGWDGTVTGQPAK